MAEFKLRCGDEEYSGYKLAADLRGVTFSAWVRDACQAYSRPPLVDDDVAYVPVAPGAPVPDQKAPVAKTGEAVKEFLPSGLEKPTTIVGPGRPANADESECPVTNLLRWWCLCPECQHRRSSARGFKPAEYA